MNTLIEDIKILRDVADHLDPRQPAAQVKQEWLEAYAADLRRLAAHLERVALSGDRAAP